ncbi:MAG TPA: cytosine permease [Acidimicrobiales bacterium]|nr:cytosine permease [Acidimicrobiales bacterium]
MNNNGKEISAKRRALDVEQHGIDYIPPEHRFGKPYRLLTLWFAGNVQITTLATGALAVVLGLNLTWAILSILIGNFIGGLYMATHSAQGPRLGVPQMIQSRAQFGMYGTSLPLIIVIIMYLGFFVLSSYLGGQALSNLLHVTTNEGIIITNVIVLVGTWFGHNWIHAYNRVMAVLSLGIFLAMIIHLLGHMPTHLPKGSVSYGTVLLVISIIVSWQLTWAPYVSDYSRYLPENTPPMKTFWYTYIGSAVGASFVMIAGALASLTAFNAMSADAPAYLASLFPSMKWLFLLIIAGGVVSINMENLYGAFLTFFTSISPSGESSQGAKGRMISTSVMAVVATIVAVNLSANFSVNLTNFIVFLLYLLIPWTAINLTDFYLIHHGRYDVKQFFMVNGRWGLVNWTAVGIFVVTLLVELPFVNSLLYEGWVAKRMGGADIAWIIGFIFAAVAYYVSAKYGKQGRLAKEEIASLEATA